MYLINGLSIIFVPFSFKGFELKKSSTYQVNQAFDLNFLEAYSRRIKNSFVNQMLLLRSSSTPLLSSSLTGNKPGSLQRTSSGESHLKVSFPVDPSPVMLQSRHIYRVNSDGDLNLSISTEKRENEIDSPVEFHEIDSPVRFFEPLGTKLERGLSFSIYERDWDDQRMEEEKQKSMEEIGETVEEDDFTFSCPFVNGDFSNKNENNERFGTLQEPTSLYMALGLSFGLDLAMANRRTFDSNQLQQHYERIIEENPGNPLMLKNYARYLYKVKEDYRKAEEFYSRAILAGPNDGEVLAEYAKLRWEIHRDEERASNYFARSIQASPKNSHVAAAYASFLWDTEESGDGQDSTQQQLTCAEAK